MTRENLPILIIGAGPAGLSAAVFSRRADLPTTLIEELSPGGQILTSPQIENYPGFPGTVSTQELMSRMLAQVEQLGATWENDAVLRLETGEPHLLTTRLGNQHQAHAVILATGAHPATLGVPGEKELTGRGVSYCATCDAPFFRNKTIFVVGGGNTAAEEALYLTRFAQKVYLVHRRDRLRADAILQQRVLDHEQIQVLWSSILTQIHGSDTVTGVSVHNVISKEDHRFPGDGVFIYVGIRPNTAFLAEQIEVDDKGFVLTSEHFQTNVPGIFACGDVRANLLKQVVVAAGEGAQAAVMASRYLESKGLI